MASQDVPAAPREPVYERARPLALAFVIGILAFYVIQLAIDLQQVLLLLFVSAVFAAAMADPAEVLRRRVRMPRGAAVAIVQGVILLVLGVVIWLTVPPLVGELSRFYCVPHYLDTAERLRDRYDAIRQDYPELKSFDAETKELGDRVGSLVGDRLADLPFTTAELLFDLLTIYALATIMVLRQERMINGVLAAVHPDRRDHVRAVLTKIWTRLGAYVRAKVIVMLVVGVLMYLALLALDVPFPVPLAVIVAFGEVIPAIGPWIARVPLLAVAATQGWEILALTFLASFILENLKAYVISPHVEGQQLDIDPLLVLIAVLVGAALMGAAGAFISVPFAAMLQVLWDEVYLPWREHSFADGAALSPAVEERGTAPPFHPET